MSRNNDFQDIMKNRRSIRNYDPEVKISKNEMIAIIEDSVTAPSSANMQPWRFLIVESDSGKSKLKPLIKFNGLQNDTSSAMILIYGDLNNFENAEKIYGSAVEKGYMPKEYKEENESALIAYFDQLTKKELEHIVLLDGGLVAMQLMLTARSYGYETNAIGGFEHDKILETFNINSDQFVPVVIISIGKSNNDKGYPSYRLPAEDISTWC